uniref:Uncharacterized protein n=1 Tax=Anguilla anguilla TaxID=7936 RepID=A0A0E9UHK1_ANGAN
MYIHCSMINMEVKRSQTKINVQTLYGHGSNRQNYETARADRKQKQ